MRDSKDQVKFLIQTSILLERQQALWATIGLQPGVRIGLVREDGVLLSLWPLSSTAFDSKLFHAKSLSHAIAGHAANGFFREQSDR